MNDYLLIAAAISVLLGGAVVIYLFSDFIVRNLKDQYDAFLETIEMFFFAPEQERVRKRPSHCKYCNANTWYVKSLRERECGKCGAEIYITDPLLKLLEPGEKCPDCNACDWLKGSSYAGCENVMCGSCKGRFQVCPQFHSVERIN